MSRDHRGRNTPLPLILPFLFIVLGVSDRASSLDRGRSLAHASVPHKQPDNATVANRLNKEGRWRNSCIKVMCRPGRGTGDLLRGLLAGPPAARH